MTVALEAGRLPPCRVVRECWATLRCADVMAGLWPITATDVASMSPRMLIRLAPLCWGARAATMLR